MPCSSANSDPECSTTSQEICLIVSRQSWSHTTNGSQTSPASRRIMPSTASPDNKQTSPASSDQRPPTLLRSCKDGGLQLVIDKAPCVGRRREDKPHACVRVAPQDVRAVRRDTRQGSSRRAGKFRMRFDGGVAASGVHLSLLVQASLSSQLI